MINIKYLTLVMILVIYGCATPGYDCPLKATPGSCSSQLTAYKTSLSNSTEGTSIFDLSHDSKNSSASNNLNLISLGLTNNYSSSNKLTLYKTWLASYFDNNGNYIDSHLAYWLGDSSLTNPAFHIDADDEHKLLQPK